jgi:hypothetical protein
MARQSTAKRLNVPTLIERVEAIKAEVEDELTNLSETYRPPSVPGPALKRMWLAKANGNPFEALLIAMKEIGR